MNGERGFENREQGTENGKGKRNKRNENREREKENGKGERELKNGEQGTGIGD